MKIKTIIAGMLENNIYIVSDETKECFIVDPGAGFAAVVSYIKKENLIPKAVLLTHGHHDHIGNVNELTCEFSIPVYVGAEDGELLENPKNGVKAVNEYKTLNDGDNLQIGNMQIAVITTPGHTKGGVCFLVGEELFTGDSIFKETIGRCDLYGGNYKTLLKSVEKVADMNVRVYPGHGEHSTMAHERNFNPYFPNNR